MALTTAQKRPDHLCHTYMYRRYSRQQAIIRYRGPVVWTLSFACYHQCERETRSKALLKSHTILISLSRNQNCFSVLSPPIATASGSVHLAIRCMKSKHSQPRLFHHRQYICCCCCWGGRRGLVVCTCRAREGRVPRDMG